MDINIDAGIYAYIYAINPDDVYEEDGMYWFISGDWEAYGLTEENGGIYTISTRPSQAGVLIGNLL